MKKGFFISFEGPDGAGKTTQIKLLAEFLKEKGEEVILTREPGGTAIGEKIRSVILDPKNSEMSDSTEMMLYAAARAQIVDELIRPNIEAGRIVLCDRFVDSSIAYQGYGRDLGQAVTEVNSHAIKECMPDITFFLKMDPELCFERKVGSDTDRIEAEDMAWHRTVYEGYLRLAENNPERIKSIDANRGVKQVQEDIRDITIKFMDKYRNGGPV